MSSPLFKLVRVVSASVGKRAAHPINPTHCSQPGAARLSRSTLLAAFDAVAAIGRSVCQPGAVGGLYGQHGRTVRPAAALINHNPW